MGWSNCGKDSRGRSIGYGFPAQCDEPGCKARINRGLAYACGGMHGECEWSCDGYFCEAHLFFSDNDEAPGTLCRRCWRVAQREYHRGPSGRFVSR